jgi:hypothetical protein
MPPSDHFVYRVATSMKPVKNHFHERTKGRNQEKERFCMWFVEIPFRQGTRLEITARNAINSSLTLRLHDSITKSTECLFLGRI